MRPLFTQVQTTPKGGKNKGMSKSQGSSSTSRCYDLVDGSPRDVMEVDRRGVSIATDDASFGDSNVSSLAFPRELNFDEEIQNTSRICTTNGAGNVNNTNNDNDGAGGSFSPLLAVDGSTNSSKTYHYKEVDGKENNNRCRKLTSNCFIILAQIAVLIPMIILMICHKRHIQLLDVLATAPTTPSTTTTATTETQVEATTIDLPQKITQHSDLLPKPKQTYPKVAWLMSFPNSGTSYTMALVESASNRTMASNYAWEGDERTAENVVDGTTNGPYWRYDPKTSTKNSGRQHSSTSALTKTHCGGYCHDCTSISDQIETPKSFMKHCASSKIRPSPHEPSISHVYDYNFVDRAVHLVRDPFDNIVSRYHNDIENIQARSDRKDGKTQNYSKERYTYDPEGFHNFCKDKMSIGPHHKLPDGTTHGFIDALDIMKDVPCALDFFRYIQWHNNAFVTTDNFLEIDTYVLNYDEYDTNFEKTLAELFDFLDLTNTGNYKPFKSGKTYRNYFTPDHIEAVKQAAILLSSPKTWKHLERYF